MDSEIKSWISQAKMICRSLLNYPDKDNKEGIETWCDNKLSRKKLLNLLSQTGYYARKSIQRNDINEKYSWEKFIMEQRKRKQRRRLQILGYAASILLLISFGCAIWIYQYANISLPANNEFVRIEAGSFKASLVLADGKEIVLDDSLTITEKDGTIIRNGNQGEISYQEEKNNISSSVNYNIIRIPRGGEYRMALADGTKVWLNSESELKFPTTFSDNKREVYLKGEAYFEIAPDKQRPFYVNNGDFTIHATGTIFNVMAYPDEPTFEVTLVEGGVNIEKNNGILTSLTPNYQFQLEKNSGLYSKKEIDPRTANGWINGVFYFDQQTLTAITRKLSRWYGVDIEFNQPEIGKYIFSGEIKKYEDANKVLDMLKLTNEISYIITSKDKIVIYALE